MLGIEKGTWYFFGKKKKFNIARLYRKYKSGIEKWKWIFSLSNDIFGKDGSILSSGQMVVSKALEVGMLYEYSHTLENILSVVYKICRINQFCIWED